MSQISEAAKSYIADSDLNTAAEVAMHLGQPLLLTGEPGTGKTSFAEYLAEVLAPRFFQCGPLPLHRFETKSTSSAADLFYRFDSLKRLQSTRVEGMSQDNRDYISFQALGLAILESLPWSEVDDLLPDRADHPPVPTRSVVLIDEVDKAPRDFPNDILNEIDRMFFRIPEVPPRATAAGLPASRSHSRDVHANKTLRPVVILTSNREKNLPDAFLRRCIFHNIRFPDPPVKATGTFSVG
jgi:MoxR-like ATPase